MEKIVNLSNKSLVLVGDATGVTPSNKEILLKIILWSFTKLAPLAVLK